MHPLPSGLSLWRNNHCPPSFMTGECAHSTYSIMWSSLPNCISERKHPSRSCIIHAKSIFSAIEWVSSLVRQNVKLVQIMLFHAENVHGKHLVYLICPLKICWRQRCKFLTSCLTTPLFHSEETTVLLALTAFTEQWREKNPQMSNIGNLNGR